MLQITIPGIEDYDSVNNLFIQVSKDTILTLEHSLVSISKWESKWCKPFISRENKTVEETIDYIKCMTITQNVDPSVYNRLTNSNIDMVNEYIARPMTATIISRTEGSAGGREIITSEVIYYWMIALNIPMECQKWHLNRLLTLIKVCNEKNKPKKKMSRNEVLRQYHDENARRKALMNTKG